MAVLRNHNMNLKNNNNKKKSKAGERIIAVKMAKILSIWLLAIGFADRLWVVEEKTGNSKVLS